MKSFLGFEGRLGMMCLKLAEFFVDSDVGDIMFLIYSWWRLSDVDDIFWMLVPDAYVTYVKR